MKHFIQFVVAITLLLNIAFLPAGEAVAQNDVFGSVKTSIKVGSSKELARSFNSVVEISLEGGEATSYSNTQAEFVMKNFFSKTPPVDFNYSHQGASDKGQRYAIGTYVSKNGSYTVLIRLKENSIQAINFIKD